MSPLLALVARNHLVYACDAGCYNATSPASDCVCGGANRGLGRAKARRQTLEHWRAWAEAWQLRHPNVEIVLIDLHGCTPDFQLRLWD